MERRFSFEPTRVPVVRRIWKMEKAKVRSWNNAGVLEEGDRY